MATIAPGGPNVALINPHNRKSKPPSSFLGKKLKLKPSSKTAIFNPKTLAISSLKAELIDAVRDLFVGVGVGFPCTVMECGDIIYRSTLPKSNGLTITAPGAVLALGALSYLWATPGVAPEFFDMFVLAFVERLFRPTYRKDDFILGKKLGEGAFGVVYRVTQAKKPPSKKEDDLVLKKATEYGAVEIWMNERVEELVQIAVLTSCTAFLRVLRRREVNIGLYGDLKGKPHLRI